VTTKTKENEANFLKHGPCPECGSSDAVGIYDDGHGHCFSCQAHFNDYEKPAAVPKPSLPPTSPHDGLTELSFSGLTSRGITEATCKFWNYQIGHYQGRPVQVANYRLDGGNVSKVRFQDKNFLQIGKGRLPLFGSWLFQRGANSKRLVVTEGEIDAMSVSQLQDNKWPVVSVPNGAAGAVRAFKDNLEYLESFETVVIMFDSDKVGQKAAEECAQVLSVGKASISILPLKDANEMLTAKRGKEVINLMWNAQPWRPDGIVSGADLWDNLTTHEDCVAHLYPWPSLNEMTMGLREGEIVTLCAGSGIGKSAVCKEIAYHLLRADETVGYIALEESTKRTALGIMGLHLNEQIYLNPLETTEEDMKTAFDATVGSGKYFTYDHWGSVGEGNLLSKMRYLVTGVNCRIIFLDHLSIVVSGLEGGDERRMIDNTMTKLRSMVEELGFALILVSHLKRPEGRGHEEGARTSLAQLRGSAGIAQLSDMVIGLERNQQDAATSKITTMRVLKNRWSGHHGVATTLEFDDTTGRLNEAIPAPEEDANEQNDF
jgi:twinkle protein